MKKITILGFLLCLSVNLFGAAFISDEGEALINSFMNLRMELTEFQDNKPEAVKVLNKYIESTDLSFCSEQEKRIMESFYISEIYNYIWNDKSNDEYLQNEFLKQIEKNEKFIAENPGKINDYLYILTADCFSCYMSYNPVAGAMKYGMKLKKYYENGLEINPENSFGLTHYAQWFFWAPGINGGSKKKSLSTFKKALDCAKTTADNFYANIFYSQICFETVDKQTAADYLSRAKKIYPKSTYVTELEYWNGQGYSLFGKDKKKAEEERNISTSY